LLLSIGFREEMDVRINDGEEELLLVLLAV
jgi:hypothetical protein